jgi:hypothetical protein
LLFVGVAGGWSAPALGVAALLSVVTIAAAGRRA